MILTGPQGSKTTLDAVMVQSEVSGPMQMEHSGSGASSRLLRSSKARACAVASNSNTLMHDNPNRWCDAIGPLKISDFQPQFAAYEQ